MPGRPLLLERDGRTERVPVNPTGEQLAGPPEHDAYRLEFDAVSATVLGGAAPPYGRADSDEQAGVLELLRRSAEQHAPLDLSFD